MALCKDDDFSDYLFMKKQIRAPHRADSFYWLACIPGFVVVPRLEKVLRDLDYIESDLLQILKEPAKYASVRDKEEKRW